MVAESELVYTLSIGDVIVKNWTADDEQWIDEGFAEEIKGDKKKKKKQPNAPLMRTRRFQVPFEFGFVSKHVSAVFSDHFR